jgi:hypothetical protein
MGLIGISRTNQSRPYLTMPARLAKTLETEHAVLYIDWERAVKTGQGRIWMSCEGDNIDIFRISTAYELFWHDVGRNLVG